MEKLEVATPDKYFLEPEQTSKKKLLSVISFRHLKEKLRSNHREVFKRFHIT